MVLLLRPQLFDLVSNYRNALLTGNAATIKQAKYDIMFRERSYSTPTSKFDLPIEFKVYRAESKEEFAVDYAYGMFKVGIAYSTGGLYGASKVAFGYTSSLLT